MNFRLVDVILGAILCFLTGACAMLWYTQLSEEEPVQPVVNIYITVQNEPEVVEEPEPEEQVTEEQTVSNNEKKPYSVDDAEMLAMMAYGEANGVPGLSTDNGIISHDYQIACTIWTVLNRVDAGWGSIQEVITAKNQFVGYRVSNPIDPDILDLTYKILDTWSVGDYSYRTLPEEYLYFRGDGRHNYFRTQEGKTYDWSLPDPFV